eukprot:TRINITY_DN14108_c0_g1_i1.p1 TRINITY_DN14108_c0_g1~~TRINITY_DN14108_c0_g1_i1.p1  ORF type:complete len:752 (+),score=72.59 TRINITY_DN14108_c0_g1_i1:64-2319(+)
MCIRDSSSAETWPPLLRIITESQTAQELLQGGSEGPTGFEDWNELNLDFKELIGVGDSSTVFKAEAKGREFAVKVSQLTREWTLTFEIIKILNAHPHPSILNIISFNIDHSHNQTTLSTATLLGECSLHDLCSVLQQERLRLTMRDVTEFVYRLSEAVLHLHDMSIYHCNIEAKNIILSCQYEPKLHGFGKAIKFNPTSTEHLKVIGKPDTQEGRKVKAAFEDMLLKFMASDLYSLGLTFQSLINVSDIVISMENHLSIVLTTLVKRLLGSNVNERKRFFLEDLERLRTLRRSLPKNTIFANRAFTANRHFHILKERGGTRIDEARGYMILGRLNEAEDLMEDIEKEVYRRDDVIDRINCQVLRADMYSYKGDRKSAEQSLLQAEAMLTRCRSDEKTSMLTQHVHEKLGQIYTNLREYSKACEYYSKTLKCIESKYGEGRINSAGILNDLGSALQSKGQTDEALQCFNQSLLIKEREYGTSHPSLAITLINLASLQSYSAQYEEAFRKTMQAIALLKPPRVRTPNFATALNNAGTILHLQKRFKEGTQFFRMALEVTQSLFGRKHSQTACVYMNLANCLCGERQFIEAEESFKEAIRINRELEPNGNPDCFEALLNYGKLLRYINRNREAMDIFKQAFNIAFSDVGVTDKGRGDIWRLLIKALETFQGNEHEYREIAQMVKDASVSSLGSASIRTLGIDSSASTVSLLSSGSRQSILAFVRSSYQEFERHSSRRIAQGHPWMIKFLFLNSF